MIPIPQAIGFKKPSGFGTILKDGLVAGGSAGAISAIITRLIGSPAIGMLAGSTVAAAIQKDEVARKIIVINGYQDGVFALLTRGLA